MFFLTLAQWCIARILEAEAPIPTGVNALEAVCALCKAFSELNVARGCGEATIVPPSVHCHTQLSPNKLAILEGWMK